MSPNNLTETQRVWVKESAAHAAEHVQRRALVGFLILLVGLVFALATGTRESNEARRAIVQTGRIVSVDGCNRDFVSRQEIRSTLRRSQVFQRGALRRGDITRTQYRLGVKFYNERLKKLPLPDCRKAANIISDNPNRVPAMPVPLHP